MNITIIFHRIGKWLANKLVGGYGHVTARPEFEKGVWIEKYGFNRYL